jgi:hypothetical protein
MEQGCGMDRLNDARNIDARIAFISCDVGGYEMEQRAKPLASARDDVIADERDKGDLVSEELFNPQFYKAKPAIVRIKDFLEIHFLMIGQHIF